MAWLGLKGAKSDLAMSLMESIGSQAIIDFESGNRKPKAISGDA